MMKMAAVSAFCLLGVLYMCVKVEASYHMMQNTAVNWQGELPCGKWDCDCAFSRQRGCCCAANQMDSLEESTFMSMFGAWHKLSDLNDGIEDLTGGRNVAFTASWSPSRSCFGPFTTNVPIPYSVVTLNQGYGYNPALGAFTAPRAGLYSFSFTVYSNVDVSGGNKLYYRVQMMKNGQVVASAWEDNREDLEDSATQTVLLSLERGCQVYTELQSGRSICGDLDKRNTFSGYLLYPETAN